MACGRCASRSSTSAHASIPTCSPSPRPTRRSTTPAASPTKGSEHDSTTHVANFLDLVEAATHYPCVKRAWVEFLGEPPATRCGPRRQHARRLSHRTSRFHREHTGLAPRCRVASVRPGRQSAHGWTPVPPLQGVGRGWGGARLLVDHRARADRGSGWRICAMPGSGCGKRQRRSATSASMRLTIRSCSRVAPATSSCARNAPASRSAYSWDGRCAHRQVRRVMPASTTKFANLVRVTHRDEVEAPLTDWMLEAYAYADPSGGLRAKKQATTPRKVARAPGPSTRRAGRK